MGHTLVVAVASCVILATLPGAHGAWQSVWNATGWPRLRSYRVYDGYTNTNGYPWLVGLGVIYPDESVALYCGASMITNQWAVTAAHCVFGAPADLLRVVYGNTNKITEQFQVEAVEQYVVHPSYNVTGDMMEGMDVALVRLNHTINITATVKLNTGAGLEAVGTPLKVDGWGLVRREAPDEKDYNVTAFDLQETDVEVLSLVECFNRTRAVLSDYLCAGSEDGKTDTCPGDSGGPLFSTPDMVQGCQVGVVSSGPAYSCNPRYGLKRAGYYQPLSTVVAWIKALVPGVQECS